MNRVMALSALLATALSSGCATLTRGTSDVLVIESVPSGAQVRLSSGQTGTTLASFQLPRKEAVTVHLEKEGYKPVDIQVIPRVAGAGGAGMAGNVLFGGLIGVAVDASTGAMMDLAPNPVRVTLEPVAGLTAVGGQQP